MHGKQNTDQQKEGLYYCATKGGFPLGELFCIKRKAFFASIVFIKILRNH